MDLTATNVYSSIVNVDSLELSSMKRIMPNDASASYLFHKISGTHMAMGGSGDSMPPPISGLPSLTANEISDIETWINQGAPNN